MVLIFLKIVNEEEYSLCWAKAKGTSNINHESVQSRGWRSYTLILVIHISLIGATNAVLPIICTEIALIITKN